MATAEWVQIRRNSEADGCPVLNGNLIESIAWLQEALNSVPEARRADAIIVIKEDIYARRTVVVIEYPP